MIVAGPFGAMPFNCSEGVRPGIFCTEKTREPRWATEKTATASDEAPQAIIVLQHTSRKAGYGSNLSATACRAAARNCIGRQGDSLIRPRIGADTGNSASLRGAVE